MDIMQKIISVLFVLSLSAGNAFACSCIGPIIDHLDRYSSHVFIGEVKSKSGWLSLFNNVYSVEIETAYKGSVGNSVTLWSGKIEDGCGRVYEVGEKYVFFAKREYLGYESGLCTSWPIERYGEDLLESIRNKYIVDSVVSTHE